MCSIHVLRHALVLLQVLGVVLSSCQVAEGGTASGQDGDNSCRGTKLPHEASAVVLQLLALHSALQATAKTGTPVKCETQSGKIYCEHLLDLHAMHD